jgi:hypothetical protein
LIAVQMKALVALLLLPWLVTAVAARGLLGVRMLGVSFRRAALL